MHFFFSLLLIYKMRDEIQKKGMSAVYEARPVSTDTKVLNMYNLFNLQKRHCE